MIKLEWLDETNSEHLKFREAYKGWTALPKPVEGHTGKYINLTNYFNKLTQELRPKTILEIGFNAGHSACCFLDAAPEASYYTFDICRHGYEQAALDVLKQYYDITLIPGDSAITVPKFLDTNPSLMFDLVFVDGWHLEDHPYLDIVNTMSNINPDGIIIIDDLAQPDVREGYSKVSWIGFEEVQLPRLEKDIKIHRKL